MTPRPDAEDGNPRLKVAIEEYKQVLKERHFVMTKTMQAVALYLALSSYALNQILEARPHYQLWLLASTFTVLNTVAFIAARRFRDMARTTRDRELQLVKFLKVEPTSELYWGYYAAVALVSVMQFFVIAAVVTGALLDLR